VTFNDSMEAKKFLVSQIADQARRGHHPLSEVEEKMLYFSETYPTPPDMAEVAERFGREYDDSKFEDKIFRISRRAFQQDKKESPDTARLWREAIKVLKKEDHYLLVMVELPRSGSDVLRLIIAAILVVVVGIACFALADFIGPKIRPRVPDSVLTFAFLAFAALLYYLAWNDEAGKRFGNWMGRVLERLSGG